MVIGNRLYLRNAEEAACYELVLEQPRSSLRLQMQSGCSNSFAAMPAQRNNALLYCGSGLPLWCRQPAAEHRFESLLS